MTNQAKPTIPLNELKYFLGTNLQIKSSNDKIFEMNILYDGHVSQARYGVHHKLSQIKPLVIPPNDLVPELAEWLVRVHLFTLKRANEAVNRALCYPEMTPFFIAQEIFNRHGDFFNWLQSGLALNKNHLK